MRSPRSYLRRLAYEPPFRLLVKGVFAMLPCSVERRARWDLSERSHYLLGLLFAAREAKLQQLQEFSAIEFGVAGGRGLIALQNEAEAVERATGVSVRVFGFDAGPSGLPSFGGDYRDHPDMFLPGDYPMDVAKLREKLTPRTTLILGEIRQTIENFRSDHAPSPLGFVSIDCDLYSSTVAALRLFDLCPKLMHVAMYFDDVQNQLCHQWAGELRAIAEFNDKHPNLKIDRWRGLRIGRPFPEKWELNGMFICHDLDAISKFQLNRQNVHLPL